MYIYTYRNIHTGPLLGLKACWGQSNPSAAESQEAMKSSASRGLQRILAEIVNRNDKY